jgi:hypothetical protein
MKLGIMVTGKRTGFKVGVAIEYAARLRVTNISGAPSDVI